MTHVQTCLVAGTNPNIPNWFIDWLRENESIWVAFVSETLKVVNAGYKHYSARTILHVIRHRSALSEAGSGWKVNNDVSPYLARLFGMIYPEHSDLWEYRTVRVEK